MQEPIHKILADPPLDREIQLHGWVKEYRLAGGKLMFIHLGDGQSTQKIQVVWDVPEDYDGKIGFESSVIVTGKFVESPAKGQKWEIKATTIELIGGCDPDKYPFAKGKKAHPLEHLRQFPHLRPKTQIFSAIIRLRDTLSFATQKFFHDHDFYWIHTPILTTSDCEGAGETFNVISPSDPKFFRDKQAYLTVSGQLDLEPFACGMSRVYVFGPSFRAEKSTTTRHLSEFWMLEPEIAFADLETTVQFAEEYFREMFKACLEQRRDEIEFLAKRTKKPLIERIEETLKQPFAKITYSEAIDILQKSKKKFEKPSEWGVDFGSDQEKYLCEQVFKRPTFITHYPSKIKAFYMYEDDPIQTDPNKRTVACCDLLLPEIGEVLGGSQREHRLEILQDKVTKAGLDLKQYQYYLDTRRFGTVPHSGFGVGFDRLLRFIGGVDHIMDVVPYPIRYQHI